MRTSVALLLVTLLGLPPAAGETPEPADPIPALLAQLGSPRFAEREAAARALEELGEPALDALRAAAASPDPEIRRRAEAVIEAIEREAQAHSLLTPARVRLSYQNVPLSEAVEDLAKKTGLPVRLDPAQVPNPSRPVTLDTGEVPLWEALERFCAAAGLREGQPRPAANPQPDRNLSRRGGMIVQTITPVGLPAAPEQITLVAGEPDGPAPDTSTPVRVRALTAAPENVLPARKDGEATFTLDVRPAPGLTCLEVVGARVRKATDPDGRPVVQSHTAPTGPGGPHVSAFGGGAAWQVQMPGQVIIFDGTSSTMQVSEPNPRHIPVTVRTGGRAVRSLKEVEGTVSLRVLTPPQELLRIDDLTQSVGREYRRGEVRVAVRDLTSDESGTVRLRAEAELPAAGPSAGQLRMIGQGVFQVQPAMPFGTAGPAAIPQPQFVVSDADGKPLRLVESQIGTDLDHNGGRPRTHVVLVFQRQKGQGEPARLVLSGPRAVTLEVPFRLKNIPLP